LTVYGSLTPTRAIFDYASKDVKLSEMIKIKRYQFYIHGSVHRDSELIRYNKMQQYAGIYLLQGHSTCFGCPSHPSSGVEKTVTAASGTSHTVQYQS